MQIRLVASHALKAAPGGRIVHSPGLPGCSVTCERLGSCTQLSGIAPVSAFSEMVLRQGGGVGGWVGVEGRVGRERDEQCV